MDKISVIIPVYNVEDYIYQCLDSIINQTYRELEIIIIDDGSLDNSGRICDEYAQKDSRIVVIHKKNAGVSRARNDGLKIATGKWITFVDPDDWCELDYYEKMIHSLPRQEIDIFCAGGAYWEYKDYTVSKLYTKRNFVVAREKSEIDWGMFCARVITSNIKMPYFFTGYPGSVCWDKIYNAGFMKKWQIQFEPMLHPTEDDLINFIMFDKATKIAGCTYIGYHYRQTNSFSITKRFQINYVEVMCAFLEKIYLYKICSNGDEIVNRAKNARAISLFKDCLRRYYFHKENDKKYTIIAKELKKIKKYRYIQSAIWSKGGRYSYKGCVLLKWVLRLPGIWPIWIFCKIDQIYPHLYRPK